MAILTLSDIFNGRQEQEVMDEIIISPATSVKGNGVYQFPTGVVPSVFDSMEIQWSRAGKNEVASTTVISKEALLGGAIDFLGTFFDGATNVVASVTFTQNSTSYEVRTYGGMLRVRSFIGFKRRIARVGLDELMSSMGLPNLVTNPDLNNPVNQRAFNGTWDSLAIGAYGYDQWIKVSNTHMGFVVEDGKYIPNKLHTLTVNNAVIKQIISPASGHFVVSIPFATSGVYDFYAGEFKRPWHPTEDSLTRCKRYYCVLPEFNWTFDTNNYGGSQIANSFGMGRDIYFTAEMRKSPNCTFTSGTGGLGPHMRISYSSTNHVYVCLKTDTPTGLPAYVYNMLVKADASIPWSELNNNIITAT